MEARGVEPVRMLQKPVAKPKSYGIGFWNMNTPSPHRIGYARVSTDDQHTEGQESKLHAAGCGRIFKEKESGGRWDRPALQELRAHLRPGDVVVVTKLDRLSRNLRDLLFLLEEFEAAGVGFECLDDKVETTSPAGRLMVQMIGAFAEFERALIRSRTSDGLTRAREEGRVGGRPSKMSKEQRAAALKMLKAGTSQAEVARIFGVGRSTVCRLAEGLAEVA